MSRDMWASFQAVKDFRQWNGQPLFENAAPLKLSEVLAGDNTSVKEREIPFQVVSNPLTFASNASDDRISFYSVDNEDEPISIMLSERRTDLGS